MSREHLPSGRLLYIHTSSALFLDSSSCCFWYYTPSIWSCALVRRIHHGRLARWIKWRACDVSRAHSSTFPSLHLRHNSFSNPSTALPTSQLILQPFHCFTYVIGTSPTSPSEPPMPLWWCLIYPWWFCNLQWLWPAGLNERCKLVLELKRLKTPVLGCC